MIVLDTNVLSELMKPRPSMAVVRWVDARSVASLYTTSLTEAELLHGIALLPNGKRRDAIDAAARAMFEEELAGRVLPFGSAAARAYAEIAAARRRAGRPIATIDAQIAAIVRATGATLATRNVSDFDGCGIDVANPWSAAG
ncbi:MAG: type II toxin-antitoxin system VapC family toxin [Myxococcota bacterium]|nr:type II toxin-antitoxin system VapC family toxin [Myxococcota bacterium]